jgi:hypothetical protein
VIIAGGGREADPFSRPLLFLRSTRNFCFVLIETRRLGMVLLTCVVAIVGSGSRGEVISISAAPAGDEGDDEPVGNGKLVARGNKRGR